MAASKKKYRETHGDFIAETQRLYRERRRARVVAASKRYRARHPDRVAESNKRYREKNRVYLTELKKRYREKHRDLEKHRARHAERQKRYQENNRGQILAYKQQYRETHRELLREKERRRHARLVEKKRTAEKLKALGPLTLTIPLTDYLKSIPVARYVKAFCDSLESVDTNVPPAENDSHTLIDLDSGTMQVAEPPDWDLDDLSFLQNISPDEWAEVLKDIEDSSSFDLEALLPPEDLVHVEDMSPDEGVDLMYDLVS